MSVGAARFPFRADRVDALIDFVTAHPLSPISSPPVRRLLTTLAPPEGVIVVGWKRRTALVAAVVDRCENCQDAAVLEVLGYSPQAPVSPLLAVAIPVAEAVARAAGRAALRLGLPIGRPDWDLAGDPGWRPGERTFTLERTVGPWDAAPPPPGATWEDLTEAGIDEHYAVTRAAMSADPSAFVPDLPTFRAACLAEDSGVRVLRAPSAGNPGAEIGFIRTGLSHGGKLGEIHTLGRVPAWRGRGLGRVLLAEALRVLHVPGVERIQLSVTGGNVEAENLYRRAGFVDVETWQAWLRSLREGA